MRILYLSCHSILEHDEVKLFRDMGHDVFSPGAYVEPRNPGDASLRPGIDMDYDPEDLRLWREIPAESGDQKAVIPRSFVERFDVTVVMHIPHWIYNNWTNLDCRPVVWRTIGQSVSHQEHSLAKCRHLGMKIVRYSPAEETIPGCIGSDALIRFYKDPDEWGNWNGKDPSVLTINQALRQRSQACNFPIWEQVTGQFNRKLYGPGNEDIPGSMGKATFEQMKQAMRDSRCYFYVGTHPASYTLNFIEAWMTGIPVVAIGPKYGNADYFPDHKLYEIPSLISSGVNGLWSDDPEELKGYVKLLLDDETTARNIGEAGRAAAIKHFAKAPIAAQWEEFLKTL